MAVDPTRQRIVRATAELLRDGGLDAVTTRAVETAAGVQAPTIYRLFGDKRGLLEAVAEHELTAWVAQKASAAEADATRDPVEILREGWLSNVRFGLENPALFALMNAQPDPRRKWAAERVGHEILRARVHRVAAAGRLALSEERALDLIHASARGAVLTLLAQPPDKRNLALLDDTLDGLLGTIIADTRRRRPPTTAASATALRAALHDSLHSLTPGELALLDELLVRLAKHA